MSVSKLQVSFHLGRLYRPVEFTSSRHQLRLQQWRQQERRWRPWRIRSRCARRVTARCSCRCTRRSRRSARASWRASQHRRSSRRHRNRPRSRTRASRWCRRLASSARPGECEFGAFRSRRAIFAFSSYISAFWILVVEHNHYYCTLYSYISFTLAYLSRGYRHHQAIRHQFFSWLRFLTNILFRTCTNTYKVCI